MEQMKLIFQVIDPWLLFDGKLLASSHDQWEKLVRVCVGCSGRSVMDFSMFVASMGEHQAVTIGFERKLGGRKWKLDCARSGQRECTSP